MSKSWKIGLSIGIPVLIIILFILATFIMPFGDRYYDSTSYDYDDDGLYAVMDEAQDMAYAKSSQVAAPVAGNVTTDIEITPIAQERLIIKTGSMSVVVTDVNESVKKLMAYAVEKGGFVVNSNIYKSGLAPYGEVTVRIPVASFDTATEDVKAMGDVTSQSMSGQDVTEEYVDLDAQLDNLRATEDQFLAIMKKAVKIEDILAVQRELTRVRGDIERIEGRMKYLRESSDLSTLIVYFSTDPDMLPVVDDDDKWKPWAVVKDSVRSLLYVGQWVADGIIFLVVFIPLWFVIGLIMWGVVRFVKRKKRAQM